MALRTDTDTIRAALEQFMQEYEQREPEQLSLPRSASVDVVRDVMQHLGYTIRLNLLTGHADVQGLPAKYSHENALNTLPTLLVDFLGVNGCRCARQRMDDYLNMLADENRFHPVVDLLAREAWDGRDRLGLVLSILGLDRGSDSATYVYKWMHQCVAMAFNDNGAREPYGADGVLVLQGDQGVGKTRFFRVLALKSAWFCEGATINMDDKDTRISALSAWITELGELDSTFRREQSALKAFITQAEDRVRPPYGRVAVPRPRRTSFCGTVNPSGFLQDTTGNRRYWTVHVDKIDLEALNALTEADVRQIWAQVYAELYLPDPGGFRMTCEESSRLFESNRQFDRPLPFEDDIRNLLNFDRPTSDWDYFKANEVVLRVVGRKPSAAQVGVVLNKLAKQDARLAPKRCNGLTLYRLPMERYSRMWSE